LIADGCTKPNGNMLSARMIIRCQAFPTQPWFLTLQSGGPNVLSDRHIKPFVRDASFFFFFFCIPIALHSVPSYCILHHIQCTSSAANGHGACKVSHPSWVFFTVWRMTSLGWGVLGVVPCLPHTVPLAWPASYLLYTFPIAVGIAARVRIALSTWEGSEISPAHLTYPKCLDVRQLKYTLRMGGRRLN
jgi:hypothetical protein